MRVPFFVLVSVLLSSAAAQAQSAPAWFVLPTGTDEAAEPRLEQVAGALTQALAAQAPSVWGRAEARARFEEQHSAQPGSISQSEIERWTERSRSALRNLARADYEAAQRDLVEAQELTAGALDELNREAEQARRLLDTCLYLARARFEAGNREAALAQVRECRARSPKASPSEGKHTPETLGLLAAVDAELASKPLGRLFVDSVPRGCTVRLNGFDYGATPRLIGGVIQGHYRVQVECAGQGEQRGRIYRVAVGPEQANLRVDTAFDRAVATQPALTLRYGLTADENAWRVRHTGFVANVLGSQHALLLTLIDPNSMRIDRVDFADGKAAVSASVIVPVSAELSPTLAREAVQALLAPASLDFRAQPAIVIQSWQPPQGAVTDAPESSVAADDTDSRTSSDPIRLRRVAGFALLGAGAAGVVAGFTLFYTGHVQDGLAFRTAPLSSYLERARNWHDSRPLGYALVGPSAALATAGLGLSLRPRDSVPWWGWASGAVGLGLVSWGAADIALGGSCSVSRAEARTCVLDQEQRDRGALVAMSAIPWLYLPVHQLVFAGEQPRATLSFEPARRALVLTGSF